MRISSLKVPKKLSGFSMSQMQDFATCRQKWMFRVNGFYNPQTSDRTSFGSVFHYFLQRLYESKEKAVLFIVEQIPLWSREIEKEAAEEGLTDAVAVVAVAETVFLKYIARFGRVDFEGRDYVRVESLVRDGRRYCKIDAAYRDEKGRLYIVEHKTRSRIDEEKLTILCGMDFQNLFETTALEAESKKTVGGVLYNVIRKPQLKQGKEETLQAYCQRIAADIDTRPEFYFIRREITYSKAEKDNFRAREIGGILAEMEAVAAGKAGVYRNTNNCETVYGTCDYLEACSSGSTDCLAKRQRKG